MSTAIRRRVEHLERQVGLEQDLSLLVFVEPGESVEEAVERGCAGRGRPREAFSVLLALDLFGSSRGL